MLRFRSLRNRVVVAVAVCNVALLIVPTVLEAQPVDTAKHQLSIAFTRRGEIWEDITSSVNNTDLTALRHQFSMVLGNLSKAEQISDWHLFQFGDDSWRTAEIFKTDLRVYVGRPCSANKSGEVESIFRRRGDEEALKKQCHDELAAGLVAAEADQRLSLDHLFKAWNTTTRKPAKCTALHDAVLRIAAARVPTDAIVITDGLETCLKSFDAIAAPKVDVKLVVVLVTPVQLRVGRGTSVESDYERRHKVLKSALPWAYIVPAFEFDERVFKR
jgi:hypothetical protein